MLHLPANWLASMLNILVTGGSRGLGLAIARKLTMAGYCAIAIARRESEELASALRDSGLCQKGSLHFKPFDLDNISKLPDLVKGLRKEFGSIYGLVNNAALGTSSILATM